MKIVTESKNWVQYAEAVGDGNPMHRDNDYAKSKGLEGIIAPGMWVVSHVQNTGQVCKAEFNFRDKVYDESVLDLASEGDKYVFGFGDKVVCDGVIGSRDYVDGKVKLPESFDHVYKCEVTSEDVGNFLESIFCPRGEGLPGMLFMSLSAPALLSYAAKKSMVGIHASQSFEMYKPYEVGELAVGVKSIKAGKRMHKLDLYWMQKDNIIGVGKAKVLPVVA